MKATRLPEMDYFEVSISEANNPGLRCLDAKEGQACAPATLASSLLQKGIVILLEPGELRCSLGELNIVSFLISQEMPSRTTITTQTLRSFDQEPGATFYTK